MNVQPSEYWPRKGHAIALSQVLCPLHPGTSLKLDFEQGVNELSRYLS